MREPPTGTITFLFTDIEGSTRLLQQARDSYAEHLAAHSRILREAISAGGGFEVQTDGDGFFATFPTPAGALRAAVEAQRGLSSHPWPEGSEVRVRMGVHTGEGVLSGGKYVGLDVNRAARIAAAGHGGQVLVSDATRALASTARGVDAHAATSGCWWTRSDAHLARPGTGLGVERPGSDDPGLRGAARG